MIDQKEMLFQLIKSMTRNEKGYFKKHASFHTLGKVNNYVVLFDIISRQEVYNEKAVKELVKGHLELKNFRRAKGYLYEMILKSLNLFHSDSSLKFYIIESLRSAEILYDKALYEQCEKILAKAEVKANDANMLNFLSEIYELQLKIMLAKSFEGFDEKDIQHHYEKWKLLEGRNRKITKYYFLNASMHYKVRINGIARSRDEIKKIYGQLAEDKLLKDEEEADSLLAKVLLYNTLGAYYFVTNESEKRLLIYKKGLKLFKPGLPWTDENSSHHLSMLSNLMSVCNQLNRYSETLELVAIAKDIKTKTMYSEMRKFVIINSHALSLFINTRQYEEAYAVVQKMEEGLNKFKDKIGITYRITFYYNIAYTRIIFGKFKEAIVYINKILSNAPNIAIDTQSFARVLNLIAHYELNNMEHLPYILRSTYRFFLKKERLFEFEKILIRYLKKLGTTDDEEKLRKLFADFRVDLLLLKNDEYESRFLEYFDLISWLESKIENIPFEEVIKRKSIFISH